MDLGIEGKLALVTGASRGLGYSAAEALGREGARLAIASRSEENIRAAAERLRESSNAEVAPLVADVGHEDAIQSLVRAVRTDLGPIDILVCNAGGPPPGPVLDHGEEAWRDALELNLLSAVRLCRLVAPKMAEQGWGRILLITSVAVRNPIDGLGLSNAARAGATGFAKTLARELAPRGVTVNCLCPGYTRTERLDELAAVIAEREEIAREMVFERWTSIIPAGRLGEPGELGALAAFLASDRAGYITGTSIAVDGGADRGLL